MIAECHNMCDTPEPRLDDVPAGGILNVVDRVVLRNSVHRASRADLNFNHWHQWGLDKHYVFQQRLIDIEQPVNLTWTRTWTRIHLLVDLVPLRSSKLCCKEGVRATLRSERNSKRRSARKPQLYSFSRG
jgi:hypothetical protein